MESRRHKHLSFPGSPRAVMATGWSLVCLCVIAAPALLAHSCGVAGSMVYLLFSRICHQIPERSFSLFGYPLAVCHRCSGIYAGMLLGCFVNIDSMHRTAYTRRFWVLGAVLPLAFDALAPMAGLWTSTGLTRFFSGLLFGTIASSLVMRGLTELAQDASWRPLSMQSPQSKGDTL